MQIVFPFLPPPRFPIQQGTFPEGERLRTRESRGNDSKAKDENAASHPRFAGKVGGRTASRGHPSS